MTLSLLRRSARQRPALVALTNHWRVCPDGVLRRDCWVRTPDGTLELRPFRDETLAAAGVAA